MALLDGQGFYRPDEQVELVADFLPWLYDEVRNDLEHRVKTKFDYLCIENYFIIYLKLRITG